MKNANIYINSKKEKKKKMEYHSESISSTAY